MLQSEGTNLQGDRPHACPLQHNKSRKSEKSQPVYLATELYLTICLDAHYFNICCQQQILCMQINCDGEPMRATHFTFKVLPRRLRLHMPQPTLLRQPSRVLNSAQRRYRSKIQTQLERPAKRPKRTLLRHAIVQSLLTNGVVLGMGVALTIAMQRLHQQWLRSDT